MKVMSYISKFGKFMLPLALTAGAFNASAGDDLPEGQSWRRIYFLDFGGNSSSDDAYRGSGLMEYEGSTTIEFSPEVSKSTKYTIAKYAPQNNGAGWISMAGDHTYPSDVNKGYFLMLNCPQSCAPGVSMCRNYPTDYIYEKQLTSSLCSGVQFKFQAYVADMEPKNSSSAGVNFITLGIYDGNNEQLWQLEQFQMEPGGVTAEGSLNWTEVKGVFSIPDNADLSTIKFRIYPMLSGVPGATAAGYDIALDDIAIYLAQPTVTFSSTEFLYKEPGKISASLSNTSFFSDMNDVSYFWEYSSDGATNWVKVGSGSYKENPTFDYDIESFDKDLTDGNGNGYYRLTIASSQNINNITEESVCCVRGVFQINETKNKVKILLCEDEKAVIDGTTFSKANNGLAVVTPNNFEVTTEVILVKDSLDEPKQICAGQDYPKNSGIVYKEVGVYELNKVAVPSKRISYGGLTCDSILISLTLDVTNGNYVLKGTENICQGKASSSGKLYTSVGSFRDTVIVDDCLRDVSEIVVHPVYDLALEETICEGSKCSLDGKTYSDGGIYTVGPITLKSSYGCDSVVVMNLNVVSRTEATLPDVEICQSDFGEDKDAFKFDGKSYKNTGKKDLVLDLEEISTSKVTGCDSITKVHVVIHPLVHSSFDTLICRDQILFGKVWSVAGDYEHEFRYETASGCDSVVTWRIKVLDIQLKLRAEYNRTSVCSGSSATLIVDLVPSNVPLTWEPELTSSNPLHPIVYPEETTDYVAHARNSVGCHATDTITITLNPNPTLVIDTVLVKERQLKINYFGGTPEYKFEVVTTNKAGVSGTSSSFVELADESTIENITRGEHVLRVHDANGCVAEAPFVVLPSPIYPDPMFSPNGDGIRDTWQIVGIESYPNQLVRIYDRFGRQVFEMKGYTNENGFTGEYNGHLLPSTDYWYVIDIEENDVQYVGHFTLLR